jgi:hypothetical protein
MDSKILLIDPLENIYEIDLTKVNAEFESSKQNSMRSIVEFK